MAVELLHETISSITEYTGGLEKFIPAINGAIRKRSTHSSIQNPEKNRTGAKRDGVQNCHKTGAGK
jgi:hypothetical protein